MGKHGLIFYTLHIIVLWNQGKSRNYMYSTVRVNRDVVSQLTHIFLILADKNLCALVHSMLKNEYFQRGGHDPEILTQIRDLEYEAQRMQATQRPQGIKDNEYFSLNIALVIDIHLLYIC